MLTKQCYKGYDGDRFSPNSVNTLVNNNRSKQKSLNNLKNNFSETFSVS